MVDQLDPGKAAFLAVVLPERVIACLEPVLGITAHPDPAAVTIRTAATSDLLTAFNRH